MRDKKNTCQKNGQKGNREFTQKNKMNTTDTT
jgi:hypothetical protein